MRVIKLELKEYKAGAAAGQRDRKKREKKILRADKSALRET